MEQSRNDGVPFTFLLCDIFASWFLILISNMDAEQQRRKWKMEERQNHHHMSWSQTCIYHIIIFYPAIYNLWNNCQFYQLTMMTQGRNKLRTSLPSCLRRVRGLLPSSSVAYNRAARLIESMEAAGLVGPLQSNGGREILVPPPNGAWVASGAE